MEIKEQLAELKKGINETVEKQLEAVKEGSLAKAEEIKKELDTQIKNFQEKQIEAGATTQKELDNLQTEIKKLKDMGASAGEAMGKTAAQLLEKSLKEDEQYKSYAQTKSGLGNKSFGLKTMTFSGNTTGQVVDNTYVPGIFGPARRNNRIRQFLAQGTMNGDRVPFLKGTAATSGAAVVAEAASKPETTKNVAVQYADATKIAHHIRISEELLNDVAAMSTFLTQQGVEDLYDIEDQQLLYGNGSNQIDGLTNGSSVLTAADTNLSVAAASKNDIHPFLAVLQALATKEYMGDLFLLNPVDYYNTIAAVDGDKQFLNRLGFNVNGGLLSIAGVPTGVTTAIVSGNIFGANIRKAATMYQREGLSVRFFDQDQDNAIKNLVTVVIEERIALTKQYADAVFYDTFANVKAAIS